MSLQAKLLVLPSAKAARIAAGSTQCSDGAVPDEDGSPAFWPLEQVA